MLDTVGQLVDAKGSSTTRRPLPLVSPVTTSPTLHTVAAANMSVVECDPKANMCQVTGLTFVGLTPLVPATFTSHRPIARTSFRLLEGPPVMDPSPVTGAYVLSSEELTASYETGNSASLTLTAFSPFLPMQLQTCLTPSHRRLLPLTCKCNSSADKVTT